MNPSVPLYEGGVKIWGNEPGPSTPDTVPPTVASTPVATAVTNTGLTLTWAASTDSGGSGLAGYDVFRANGTSNVLVGSPASNTLAMSGLAPGTTYSFSVVAFDGAGNRASASPAVTVTTTTTPVDTSPPTTPGVPTASAVTSTGVSLAWAASTDNVGVTRYRVYRGTTLLATVPTTTYAVTGLSPSTGYQFSVVAVDAAGNTSAASAPVAVTTAPAPTGSSCQITYVTNDWNTGFSANVTVRNTGTAALSSWTLAFAFPGGQQITQIWSARASQSGANVTVTNETWNGAIAAGASVSFGFNGSHTGTNPRPTSFTLNGSACTIA